MKLDDGIREWLPLAILAVIAIAGLAYMSSLNSSAPASIDLYFTYPDSLPATVSVAESSIVQFTVYSGEAKMMPGSYRVDCGATVTEDSFTLEPRQARNFNVLFKARPPLQNAFTMTEQWVDRYDLPGDAEARLADGFGSGAFELNFSSQLAQISRPYSVSSTRFSNISGNLSRIKASASIFPNNGTYVVAYSKNTTMLVRETQSCKVSIAIGQVKREVSFRYLAEDPGAFD